MSFLWFFRAGYVLFLLLGVVCSLVLPWPLAAVAWISCLLGMLLCMGGTSDIHEAQLCTWALEDLDDQLYDLVFTQAVLTLMLEKVKAELDDVYPPA